MYEKLINPYMKKKMHYTSLILWAGQKKKKKKEVAKNSAGYFLWRIHKFPPDSHTSKILIGFSPSDSDALFSSLHPFSLFFSHKAEALSVSFASAPPSFFLLLCP